MSFQSLPYWPENSTQMNLTECEWLECWQWWIVFIINVHIYKTEENVKNLGTIATVEFYQGRREVYSIC